MFTLPYSSYSDIVKIKSMFQGNTSHQLHICGRWYCFDFVQMKQVNAATGFSRDVSWIIMDFGGNKRVMIKWS